jgi:hypothetical protein
MCRGVATLAATLVPLGASAQTATASWSNLDRARGSKVYVQDDASVETKGRLLRLDPASLVIQVDGAERTFESTRIRRVQKRDSLRNGALIGAVFGATYGLVAVAVADCPGDDPGGPCPWARAGLFAFGIGTWTAVGIGIDAVIPGRTTLYQAPAVGSLPMPARRFARTVPPRAALSVTFGW